MLSTRYVYDHNKLTPFTEKSAINGMNNYGKNKIIVENNLKKILKKRLLILRIGTFLYFNTKKKNSFIHILLYNLKKKQEVVFELDKDIFKDFLTEIFFVKNLEKLLKKNITGIFNLSSGIPLKPLIIVKNIIKGYAKGVIKFTKYKKKDKSFVMCNKKIFKITKIRIYKKKLLNLAINIGKKLKNE
jgi:dTDP-4-dehydrorhamnose reductase